jgi:uncharacterized protein (DUF2267 family)
MSTTSVEAFNHTMEKSHEWLTELCWEGRFESVEQAYSSLRAVLHSLRDRLTVDEAVHLAAEMPMLIRGMYYEGWRPAQAPNRDRTVEQFCASIEEGLKGGRIEPEWAARAVFHLLDRKISAGELRDVTHMLPRDICYALWPEHARA